MSFQYHEPVSLAEAVDLGARFGADGRFLAGGTDLIIQMRRGKVAPRHVLSLHRVPGLDAIEVNGSVRLGALVTHRAIERCASFQGRLRGLVEGAEVVGGHQIRNVGTVGGNIVNASPAADGVPVLMAYDAVVVLESRRGRQEVPLDRFYSGYKEMQRRPDQLVVAIRIPRRRYSYQVFEKVGARRAQAIAKVGLAITHSGAGWRVVAASVAPTIRRCPAVERLLETGTPIASPEGLLPAIAQDVAPIDDIRSSAHYRTRVMARLLYHDLRDVWRKLG